MDYLSNSSEQYPKHSNNINQRILHKKWHEDEELVKFKTISDIEIYMKISISDFDEIMGKKKNKKQKRQGIRDCQRPK